MRLIGLCCDQEEVCSIKIERGKTLWEKFKSSICFSLINCFGRKIKLLLLTNNWDKKNLIQTCSDLFRLKDKNNHKEYGLLSYFIKEHSDIIVKLKYKYKKLWTSASVHHFKFPTTFLNGKIDPACSIKSYQSFR